MSEYEGSRTEFLKMLAEQDSPPAYLMRAERVESVWQGVLDECRKQQYELLEMPRTRLAQLADLITLRFATLDCYVGNEMAAYLAQLHQAWQPQLRVPLPATNQPSKICRAVKDLKASFLRFNRRWEAHVAKVDLSQVNYERDQYNDYYLVEKAAALGSDRLAEMGFERLAVCTHDDILTEFPTLRVPD